MDTYIQPRKRKQDDEDDNDRVYKVTKLTTKGGAECHCMNGGVNISVELVKLIDEWVVVKKPQTAILDWQNALPSQSKDLAIQLVKDAILAELFKLCCKHDEKTKGSLSLYINPTCVKAENKIAAKQLVLTPMSRTIGHRCSGDAVPQKAVDLGELQLPFGNVAKLHFHIVPMFRPEANPQNGAWISPYFLINETDDEPNMVLNHKVCTLEVADRQYKVSMPILQNSVAISKGDQLVRARA